MPKPTILETRISIVKNARDTMPRTITLADAVKAITGPNNAVHVAEIRRAIAEGRADDARKLKCSIQGIMFAGEFTRRRANAITRHSGLLVLDFDHLDEPERHRNRIGTDPHAALCFVSPSGKGLKAVVRIDPDPAGHGALFDAARAYYMQEYGLEADLSGRDVARLCFVSHDPGAILREHPQVLHRPYMTTQTIYDYTDNTCNEGKGSRSNVTRCYDRPPPPATPAGSALASASGVLANTPPKNETALPRLYGLCNIENILAATQPTQPGQRHRKIFALARGLRFECALADAPMPELKKIVKRWFEIARPKIGTQDFTDSWSDFVHAWKRVKTPLSQCAINVAWKSVQSGNMPPEADQYDREEVRRLVALCWHLGRNGEFYLSMSKAASLLNVKPMMICRWLKMMQADEVLTLVKPGTRHTAAHYRWTAPVSKNTNLKRST